MSPGRLEGGHLLVPGLDELRLVSGPAEGGEDTVDPVAGVGEHMRHVPRTQPFEQVVSNIRCHYLSSLELVGSQAAADALAIM
jgi:hypothetical protein